VFDVLLTHLDGRRAAVVQGPRPLANSRRVLDALFEPDSGDELLLRNQRFYCTIPSFREPARFFGAGEAGITLF
jgi:hypothetical protein